MKLIALFLLLAAFCFAVNLLAAQVTCFGLAQYHVQSGLGGPFALIVAAEIVTGAGVTMTGGRGKR